jgi:hypothetical protein
MLPNELDALYLDLNRIFALTYFLQSCDVFQIPNILNEAVSKGGT